VEFHGVGREFVAVFVTFHDAAFEVEHGGDVSVTADQGAVLDARVISNTESGQFGVGITMAFNSIGWNASNVLYNTLDVLIGDPNLTSLTAIPGAGASARITGTRFQRLLGVAGRRVLERLHHQLQPVAPGPGQLVRPGPGHMKASERVTGCHSCVIFVILRNLRNFLRNICVICVISA
jgi:hypothetical protein